MEIDAHIHCKSEDICTFSADFVCGGVNADFGLDFGLNLKVLDAMILVLGWTFLAGTCSAFAKENGLKRLNWCCPSMDGAIPPL